MGVQLLKNIIKKRMKKNRIKKLIIKEWALTMRVKKYTKRDRYEFELYKLYCFNNEEGD